MEPVDYFLIAMGVFGAIVFLLVRLEGRAIGSVTGLLAGDILRRRIRFAVRRQEGSIPALDRIQVNAHVLLGHTVMALLSPGEVRELAAHLGAAAANPGAASPASGIVGAVKDYSVHVLARRKGRHRVGIEVQRPPIKTDDGAEIERDPYRGRLTARQAEHLAAILLGALR